MDDELERHMNKYKVEQAINVYGRRKSSVYDPTSRKESLKVQLVSSNPNKLRKINTELPKS